MRHSVRSLVLLGLAILAICVANAAGASAQQREFTGRIDRVSDKKMIVDNRMGDKLSFERVEGSVVEGTKSEWKDLRSKDWVTVYWKLVDKPRKAYRVVVLPPRADDGD